MKIKICGMTDADAIEAAVDAGVDALGFVFAESPREVTLRQARALAKHIPGHIARVAVTRDPGRELVREIFEVFAPDFLQSDAGDFSRIELVGLAKTIPVYREAQLEPPLFAHSESADRRGFEPDFLYEGEVSGQGETVDWARAARFASHGRMILAGGLNPENVAEAIARVRPWGVDVSSGVESYRGKKDPDLIRAFVSAVRTAARELNEESET